MDPPTLFANYFFACLKYAADNGGVDDYTQFHYVFSAITDGPECASITTWNHPSTPPTEDQLAAYSLNDLDEVKTIYECTRALKDGRPIAAADAHITALTRFAQKGQLAYNETTQQLLVYVGEQWLTLLTQTSS